MHTLECILYVATQKKIHQIMKRCLFERILLLFSISLMVGVASGLPLIGPSRKS
jgi:hypothetical protein